MTFRRPGISIMLLLASLVAATLATVPTYQGVKIIVPVASATPQAAQSNPASTRSVTTPAPANTFLPLNSPAAATIPAGRTSGGASLGANTQCMTVPVLPAPTAPGSSNSRSLLNTPGGDSPITKIPTVKPAGNPVDVNIPASEVITKAKAAKAAKKAGKQAKVTGKTAARTSVKTHRTAKSAKSKA